MGALWALSLLGPNGPPVHEHRLSNDRARQHLGIVDIQTDPRKHILVTTEP